MNSEHDELREMWLEESGSILPGPVVPSAGKSQGRSQVERLRRLLSRDARMKLGAPIFLGAAFVLLTGRMNVAIWSAIGFTLLSFILGVIQLIWSSGWNAQEAPLPLAQALAADMETWRRRRPLLALLLGSTPALFFQVYILGYLASHSASLSRPVNLIMLIAGGPFLWALSSWMVWARLEAWMLQLQRALGAFDEEAAKRLQRARRRTTARTAIVAGFLLALFFAGVVIIFLVQRT